MVIARLMLIGVACLYASSAAAVTADELRGAAAEQDRETTQKQSRTDTGSMGSLLPVDPQKSGNSQTSSKYDTGAKAAAKKHAAKKHDAAAASGIEDVSNLYTPPPRSSAVSGGQAIVTDAVRSTVAFGIRLGSWLNASLDRNTTSGESGSVELTLTGDAIGDRRTLPAGTVLFADKNLNNTTMRMEMVVTHGITPTGLEFEMHGLVFDPQKTPGLAGVYVLDKKESVSRGAQKGAIAAVGAAVGMAGPGVAGVATNAAAQSVLNDASTVTDNNAAQAVIYVSPQALIIRVEKQF
jgi:hypothetical protein